MEGGSSKPGILTGVALTLGIALGAFMFEQNYDVTPRNHAAIQPSTVISAAPPSGAAQVLVPTQASVTPPVLSGGSQESEAPPQGMWLQTPYRGVQRMYGPEPGRCRVAFATGQYEPERRAEINAELCPNADRRVDPTHVDTIRDEPR